MDFALSDDQQAIQDAARQFSHERFAPNAAEREKNILAGAEDIVRVTISREVFR